MFVLFTNAAQSKFLIFWPFFYPIPSDLNTQTLILTQTANKEHFDCALKKLCLVENVTQGHSLWLSAAVVKLV